MPFGYKVRVSYGVLRAAGEPSPAEIARFEAVANRINIAGANRTTSGDRFREIDPWLLDILAKRFDRNSELVVHEWAASDCHAAARWAVSLFERFPNANVVASDLVLSLVEYRTPKGESFIFDSEGTPLQYIRPPYAVRLTPPERIFFPVNWLLGKYARLKITAKNHVAELPHTEISLVHPKALALAKADRRFTIRRHSVFEPLSEPVDVIRALNIFNPVYFDEPKLITGINAAWSSLRDSGVFITGRTTDAGEHRICVLRKTDNDFELLDRYGEAPEIEALALKASRA